MSREDSVQGRNFSKSAAPAKAAGACPAKAAEAAEACPSNAGNPPAEYHRDCFGPGSPERLYKIAGFLRRSFRADSKTIHPGKLFL